MIRSVFPDSRIASDYHSRLLSMKSHPFSRSISIDGSNDTGLEKKESAHVRFCVSTCFLDMCVSSSSTDRVHLMVSLKSFFNGVWTSNL